MTNDQHRSETDPPADSRSTKGQPARPPTGAVAGRSSTATHDLRRRYWGHSIEFLRRRDDGSWTACIFLTARIRAGDFVLAQGRDGDLRYVVHGDVDTPLDPGDQHFVKLVHVPDDARRTDA